MKLLLRVAVVLAAALVGSGAAGAPHAATPRSRPHAAASSHAARLAQRDAVRLQAQLHAAQARPLDPRLPRVVFIGAALDDESSAFAGDVRLTLMRLRTWAPQTAALTLANGHAGAPWPRATRRRLHDAVVDAAKLLAQAPRGTPRLAVVLLSSHGARDLLALETPGMREPAALTTAQIERLLQPLADTPTLLVISACHAGSMIPALHAPQRVIFAAARADRSSFGCQPDSHATYFVEELLAALRPERSLRDGFDAAAVGVGAREQRMGLSPPSLPQLDVGAAMQAAAAQPLATLLGTPAAR
jgi:hypothetical protein